MLVVRIMLCAVLSVWLGMTSLLFAQEILDAARDGDLARVKSLVEADPAQLQITNENLKSAVHFSAQTGQLDILKYLQAQGADLDAPNIANEAPLLYAVFFGHTEVVEYLLAQGVDVNRVSTDGDTALDLAVLQEDETIKNLLKARGGIETEIGLPEVQPLADHIRRVTFPYGQLPNICTSSGADGTLLVDTGYQRTLEPLRKYLDRVGVAELPYIINTHQHPDHAGSNAVHDEHTVIIDIDTIEQLAETGVVTRGSGPVRSRQGKSFPLYYCLAFNDEEIWIIPSPGVHTDKDMLVYFSESNVVHMGDLLITQSFPSVQLEVAEYLEILDTVVDVFDENTVLICGHGKESSLAEVRQYRQMLADIMTTVVARLDKGESLEAIKQAPELQTYEAYGQFIPILSVNYWIDAVGRYHERG